AREQLRRRRAELFLDSRGDLLERARRDLVLQPFQLRAERLREEVRHDRQRLADLDEEALELEDRLVDALRVPPVDLRQVLLAVPAPEDLRLPEEPEVAEDDLKGRRVRPDEAPLILARAAIPHDAPLTTLRRKRPRRRCGHGD